MWFDEDINLTIETGPVINVSGTFEFSNIDNVTVYEFEQPIIIQTSDYYAPVQSVNGKIGWVTIDKNDVGLSNVENISITGVSGYLQYQINNLDISGGYATDLELSTTSGVLNQKINNLSGDADNKFYLKSNPSGFLTGVDLSPLYPRSNPSGFLTGVDLSPLYPRSNPSGFLTGVDLSPLYPRSNPSGFLTGVDTSNLYPRNNPSGFITGVDLSALYPRNNPSGFITNQNVVYTTGNQTISGDKTFNDGILFKKGNMPIGYITGRFNQFLEANYLTLGVYPFSGNEGYISLDYLGNGLTIGENGVGLLNNTAGDTYISSTNDNALVLQHPYIYINSTETLFNSRPTVNYSGVLLEGEIPTLPSTIVYTTGNQTISGIKNFVNDVYIKNLFVTGTETIVSTTNFNVQSPYLLLNLTGGANDGGIFFVTGSGLSGINDYGPIIGFDHSNKFKFGIARRSDDLAILNDIAAVQDITNYSGFVNSNFYPKNNPSGYITGVNLSNYVTKTSGQFLDRPTVNGIGVLLSGEAASLPSTIVYITGNQDISGRKAFKNSATNFGVNFGSIVTIGDDLYGGELGLLINEEEVLAIKMMAGEASGSFQYGGGIPGFAPLSILSGIANFTNRPTVNGTGVLLSGEAVGSANFRYFPANGVVNLLSNNRYSFDTLTGISTGILPLSPQKGDEIELYDAAGTWDINPLIVGNNGNYIEQKRDILECNVRHGLIKLVYTPQNNIGWRIYPMPIHNVPLFLPPSIAITGASLSGIVPFAMALTGVSLLDPAQAPVDEWYWNLNTGDGYAVSGQTIAYTYLQTGLYNVTLSGSNAAGFDVEHRFINVFLPYIPTVNVISNKLSGIAPFTGQLGATNTTQPAQFSPVDNWYWDFDGDTIFDATGQNTTVVYNTTGTYTPTAYGVNLGGTGTGFITINVIPPLPPIPAISTSSISGFAPLTLSFTGVNLQTPAEFSPVDHWYWNVSGDSAPEFDQSVITYTFNETGNYTFYLTAVNSGGSGVASGTFSILETPPGPDWSDVLNSTYANNIVAAYDFRDYNGSNSVTSKIGPNLQTSNVTQVDEGLQFVKGNTSWAFANSTVACSYPFTMVFVAKTTNTATNESVLINCSPTRFGQDILVFTRGLNSQGLMPFNGIDNQNTNYLPNGTEWYFYAVSFLNNGTVRYATRKLSGNLNGIVIGNNGTTFNGYPGVAAGFNSQSQYGTSGKFRLALFINEAFSTESQMDYLFNTILSGPASDLALQ